MSQFGERRASRLWRRSVSLQLRRFLGWSLAKLDAALPPDKTTRSNEAVLRYYRSRQRLAALAVLRLAWRRSGGRPGAAATSQALPSTPGDHRAKALAHMLQLRKLCRVRGEGEAVEPFGMAVVAFL